MIKVAEDLLKDLKSNDTIKTTLENIEAISLPSFISENEYVIGIESSNFLLNKQAEYWLKY
jgi:hypothetical protein